MPRLTDYPIPVFLVSVLLLWLSVRIGSALSRRHQASGANLGEDFGVVQGATLTLLGLIIGFSFSMAIGRYDQRKNYEEEEANAIGTEYLRADLLTTDNAAKARSLLTAYLHERIAYYETRDPQQLQRIDAETTRLQTALWSVVRPTAETQPTPVMALAISGMNDVLNSQGYTQAAWRNRIPPSAWILMLAIAVCGNVMVGYGARSTGGRGRLQWVLPLVISIAFLLIADIDSPRSGLIRLNPLNLLSLTESLRPH